MDHTERLKTRLLWLFTLNNLDALLTAVGIEGRFMQEANPIMVLLITWVGLYGFVVVKTIVGAISCSVLWWCKDHPKASTAIKILIGLFVCVCAWNFSLIVAYLSGV